MMNDALGTDIDPEYIECPFDGSVHDTMADASEFREATGWEPEIGFAEGVERVCTPSREADAPGTTRRDVTRRVSRSENEFHTRVFLGTHTPSYGSDEVPDRPQTPKLW
jgi:hypothetical protein